MTDSREKDAPAGNGVDRLVNNTWVVVAERLAIYLMVPGIGLMLYLLEALNTDLAVLRHNISDPVGGVVTRVAEINTIQEKAIVPAIRAVEEDVIIIMKNLLDHPRFDQQDGLRLEQKSERGDERLDAEHRRFMETLDERLRQLEGTAHPRHP